MRTDDIYITDWQHARVYLRARFVKGTIAYASQRDLERSLVILAHAGEKDPWPKETEDFRSAISVLLQVKVARQVWILTLVCAGCGIIQAFGVFWMIFH